MRNSCIYKLAGPVTFRRASTKILGDKSRKNVGWGNNLQNIESSIRQVYIPDGYSSLLAEKCAYWLDTFDTSVFTEEELVTLRVFLQTDQAGAEALIVAYDCTLGDYRSLFIHGVKVHVYVALKLFKDIWRKKATEHGIQIEKHTIEELCNTPIKDLKKNPYWREIDLLIKDSDHWSLQERYYYLAKQTVHSSNYGIQWHTFIMNILEKSGGKIVVSREDGERFLIEIRGLFPEVPARCERVKQQVIDTGILYNMFGFPYIIWEGRPPDSVLTDFKKFYAWGPQSTVGEITRTAFSTLYEYAERERKSWDILADTHDSYLVQCPLMDARDCALKMQEFMNISFTSPIDGAPFRMKSETKVGFNWSSFSETNKLGLREIKL